MSGITVESIHQLILDENFKSLASNLQLATNKATTLLNTVASDGTTALYFCCLRKIHENVLKVILASNPSVEGKGEDRETPLYIAAHNNLVGHVRMLIAAGANVNSENGANNETPLHAAAKYGFMELVVLLLKSGANINARSARLETPIFHASKSNKIDMVFLLLTHDANPNLGNEDGKNAVYIASETGNKQVVQLLQAEKKHLKDTKAHVDAEVRSQPPSFPSLEVLATSQPAATGKDAAKSESKKGKEVEKEKKQPEAPPKPMEIIEINVPITAARSHDPLTGIAYGKCKTLEEVGYSSPAPIPKELEAKLKLIKYPSGGGTTMQVGTGTGETFKQPPQLSMFPEIE